MILLCIWAGVPLALPIHQICFVVQQKTFKCKLEVLSDRDYLAIISVQKYDQDIIQ